MAKPYIDTYKNENGDLVIVYIEEVRPMEAVEPSHIVINKEHVTLLIEYLDEYVGG